MQGHPVTNAIRVYKAPLAPQANSGKQHLNHIQYYVKSSKRIKKYDLQVDPLSTISAICPKVIHGHQHVKQPVCIIKC